MSDLIKFEGWDLDATEAAPRVLDLDVATRGGMKRPRDVRKLIKRNAVQLARYGEVRMRGSVARISKPNGGIEERTVQEYWLNEGQAYALVALMRTDIADDLRFQLVSMFLAYRDARLAPTVTVDLNMVHGPTVGQVPDLRADVVEECQLTVRAAKLSLSRVHGVIRQIYRVPSIYFLSTLEWPNAKRTLRALALGKLHVKVPAPPKQLPADRRQIDMWRSN